MKQIAILLFLCFLAIVQPAPTLSVSYNQSAVDAIATYTWSITFDTSDPSNPRTSISLMFNDASEVYFSNQTIVEISNGGTFSELTTDYQLIDDNQVLIPIPSGLQNQLSFEFKVLNVRNSYREITIDTFATTNIGEYIVGDSLTFYSTEITTCMVGFIGSTWDTDGTFFMNFTASTWIPSGIIKFSVSYPFAYEVSKSQLVKSGVSKCSFKRENDTDFIPSTYPTTGIGQFVCSFTIQQILAQQNVILKLENVVPPPLSTGYGTFSLIISDQDYDIQKMPDCSISAVDVAIYTATYNSVVEINQLYLKPILTNSFLIPVLSTDDTIAMTYSGVEVSGCSIGNTMTFKRGASANTQFTINSIDNVGGQMQLKVGIGNNKTGQAKIEFNTCSFMMPYSQTPVSVVFIFSYKGNPYMEIHSSLQASAKVLTNSQFSLSLSDEDRQIGNNVTYTFSLTTTSLLGSNPSILIDFPSGIGFEAFLQDQCDVVQEDLNNKVINSITCSIYNAVTKVINITLDASADIQPQILTISILNIANPSIPLTYTGFGVQTYYSKLQTSSVAEKGFNLFSQSYLERKTDKIQIISDNVYTVNLSPSYFTFQYVNMVSLPLGGIIEIEFLDGGLDFTEVFYSSVSVNDSSLLFTVTKNTNNTFTLRHTYSIGKYSRIQLTFKFRAPGKVGNYSILSLRTYAIDGTVYQYSKEPLILEIETAAQQSFSVAPTNGRTGALTEYIFSFYTSITHTNPFTFQIFLPQDVLAPIDLIHSCTGSSTTNATMKYEDGRTVLIVEIDDPDTSRYYLTVSNIYNPREVGSTGTFKFKTFDTDNSQILGGTSTAVITLPNDITAWLDPDQVYYRSQDSSLLIYFTPTNDLYAGDYLYLTFDYRTYSSNGEINCSLAFCQDLIASTSVTLIQVTLLSNVTSDTSEYFYINGLISYGSTVPTTMKIGIESYSQNGNLIDSGQFDYQTTCSDASVIDLFCKQCIIGTDGKCTQCYTDEGFILYQGTCTNNCGNISQYETYPGSNDCVSCYQPSTNNCKTCITANKCLTCQAGHFLFEDQTCQQVCPDRLHYQVTLGSQDYCLKCFSEFCEVCKDGSSNGCETCLSGYFWNAGVCSGQCSFGSYSNGTACLLCDDSCYGCEQGGNTGCDQCFVGYYNISGRCLNGCPAGSVVMEDTCGCDSPCLTCQTLSNFCLTCDDSSLVLYSGSCLSTCPNNTYQKNKQCQQCNVGCMECTSTTCLECLSGYSIYQNKCYTQCNDIGERYAGSEGKCIECPEGCDVCNATYDCSICLTNYTLQDTICILTCQLQGDCEPENLVPDQVIPLPGFITAGIWLGLVLVLKIFIINGMYVPYSFVYVGCLIQFILMLVVFIYQKNTIQLIIEQIKSVRLLQTSQIIVQDYQYGVLGLLATTIALNYISNIVYIVFFCKYLKKYIADRQVDVITNYLVLVLGTLTNYRFSLLAYSKMFPKPKIEAQIPSNLTPLHYLCISNIFLSLFPLIAACILIYNQYPLTDLFMLGIDLLIILILNILFSIWMVSTEKPDEYFTSTKKYSMEENYKTEQNFNDKDNKNLSKVNLVGKNQNQSGVHVMDYQEEGQDIDFEKSMIQNQHSLKIAPVTNKNKVSNRKYNDQEVTEKTENDISKNLSNTKKIQNNQESTFTKKDENKLDDKSDNENQPLPNKPIRSSQINLQTYKAEQQSIISEQQQIPNGSTVDYKMESSIITKRKQMNRSAKKEEFQSNKKLKEANKKLSKEGGIQSKIQESTKNFSKEKVLSPKKTIKESQKTKRLKQIESESIDEGEQIPVSLPGLKGKSQSGSMKKQKKPMKAFSQRSETQFKKQPNMRKKDSYGIFESDHADTVIDQIDLESIIQSKMIDKTKKTGKGSTTKTQIDYRPEYEDISPSWFNAPNQRYDLEDDNSEY